MGDEICNPRWWQDGLDLLTCHKNIKISSYSIGTNERRSPKDQDTVWKSPDVELVTMRRGRGPASASSTASSSSALFGGESATSSPALDTRIPDLLKELHQLIQQTQEERARSEHNLTNIQKTHERIQYEQKGKSKGTSTAVSPYFKSKLRGLYSTAKADAEVEADLLRKCLDKIAQIKAIRNERRIAAKSAGIFMEQEPPRKTMRRGVLMTLLQQSAMTLPLWIGKPGESPPPLCGAVQAGSDYVAKPGDKVAARVKGPDGDEQWILAEVVSFNTGTNNQGLNCEELTIGGLNRKGLEQAATQVTSIRLSQVSGASCHSAPLRYEVDDIDSEEGKERHTLSRRRVIPLPQWKANPETDPEALFHKDTLVLALYPQTTCFYRALIHAPPTRDDYSVLFEDTSYADGYSPPLTVAQRYVVSCKESKKR